MATSTVAKGFGYSGRITHYYGAELPDHVAHITEEFVPHEDMYYVAWRTRTGNTGRMAVRGRGKTPDSFDENLQAAIVAMKLTD